MPSSEISTKVTRMFVLHRPLSPGSPPAPHLPFYQVKIRTHHSVRLQDPFFMLSNLWLLKLWKGNVASKHRVQQNHWNCSCSFTSYPFVNFHLFPASVWSPRRFGRFSFTLHGELSWWCDSGNRVQEWIHYCGRLWCWNSWKTCGWSTKRQTFDKPWNWMFKTFWLMVQIHALHRSATCCPPAVT